LFHKFNFHDINLVLDVNSGMVHALDQVAWDVVDHFDEGMDGIEKALDEKYGAEVLREAYDELCQLKEAGLFESADSYREKVIGKEKSGELKAMCFNIAHDCNIRCGYCFASTGDYHGGRKLMSLETAKAGIDFLLEKSGTRKRLEVDFFGGEPLLNFDVIKETVRYGREKEKALGKRIGFTMTTNGVLLNDENIEYLNENMDNVVVSLDGRPEVNDRMRKFVGGKGTTEDLLPLIKKFVEKRGERSYYIRGTYTAYNLDFSEDALFMADQGFREISVEPVVAEPERPYAITEEHLPQIFSEYEKLADDYLRYKAEGRPFRFYHFMMDMDGGPCVYKRVSSCGAGVEYFAITPDGELYPCHQFVGREDYLMGNLKDGITRQDLLQQFSENTVYHKKKCQDCWAKFHCSGGCQANAAAFSGKLSEPYDIECQLQKKRIECALSIQASEILDTQYENNQK